MTQEEKARRFDEVLAMAKDCITYIPDDAVNQYMLDMFPELKESEDEKIRKELIEFVKSRLAGFPQCDKYVAWLEKQVQTFTKKDVDDAYLKGVADAKNEIEKQYEANYQIRKDIATFIFNYRGDIKDRAKWMDYLGIKVSFVEKQGDKPFDYENANIQQKDFASIEPRFKVGDWVVFNNKHQSIYQVEKIEDGYYILRHTHGGTFRVCVLHDESLRLWTIQDAKDGDVLASDNKNCPFIYRTKTVFGSPVAYCGVRSDGLFISESPKDHQWCLKSEVQPAPKEQRDLLFQKMKEAGYEFDFDKKELKKIEPFDKYEGLTDFERTLADICIGWIGEEIGWKQYIKDNADVLLKIAVEKFNSVQDVPFEQKRAWSEEDIRMSSAAMELITICPNLMASHSVSKSSVITWLKSLKFQSPWKPSDEQIHAFEQVYDWYNNNFAPSETLTSLYNDLKKLK